MAGPLDGIRIIDATTVMMGPYCSQTLGDWGADVIKVEAPGGDTTRMNMPMRHQKMGTTFMTLNRNKRSILLDLKNPAGKDAFLRLAKQADVVMYNIRPAAMERLGLGADALRAANPRLVVVGLVGFAQDGPYGPRPAYDDMIQSLSGIASILQVAGAPHPTYVPTSIMDRGVGTFAAGAIMAALFHRERTGQGQELQIPMLEVMASQLLVEHFGGGAFVPTLGQVGYQRALSPLRRPFPTKDGKYLSAVISNNKQWTNFLSIVGRQEMMETEPRVKDVSARSIHAEYVFGLIAEVIATKTLAEWLPLMLAGEIPCAPVHTLDSLLEDEHLTATGFYQEVEHPSEGKMRTTTPIGKWTGTPPSIRRLAPRMGEHSVEILREAGLDKDQIQAMLDSGATQQDPTYGANA